MADQDIRWRQRLSNYAKAMSYLEEAMQIVNPDVVQRAGLIQFFEMSFELAWKLLKDYLEYQGFVEVKSPRNAIKKAFEVGLLENGHDWMALLTDRNLTTHTYDEQKAYDMEMLIKHKYFQLLSALLKTFNRLNNEK